jgi:hypothetical protein
MAARIPLVKSGSATSGAASNGLNASIRVSLANPPFLFDAPGTDSSGVAWTGSILIQSTPDTMPGANGGGYLGGGSGVLDTAARWETIATLTPTSGPINWPDPLYRVRANTASVTGSGHPDVYMFENVRQLKHQTVVEANEDD